MLAYNIVFLIISPCIFPIIILYSLLTGKRRKGIVDILGIIDNKIDNLRINTNKRLIWIYALSIGEIKAVAPILKEIKNAYPDLLIALSTTTDAGFLIAKKDIPFADIRFYHPIDFLPIIKRVIKLLSPTIIIITETGFWPNLIFQASQKGIPLILVHGRISQNSMARYRFIKGFVRLMMDRFNCLIVQNTQNTMHFKSLGISDTKIRIMGDTKYDTLLSYDTVDHLRLKATYKIEGDSKVMIAGSTHEGEEDVILNAFIKIREALDEEVYLIIAPRRIERIPEIIELMKYKGIRYITKTELTRDRGLLSRDGINVILLDAIGELAVLYSIATIVFVGRSLFKPGGGHSLIEPTAFGKPVIHGPYVEYNQETADTLKRLGLAFIADDEDDIAKITIGLLNDNEKLEQIYQKGKEYIKGQQGASRAIAGYIIKSIY